MVALVNELERRRLVRRQASRNDRRSNELRLTPAGRRLVSAALALQTAHEERVSERLGQDERKGLLAVLERLTDLRPSSQEDDA